MQKSSACTGFIEVLFNILENSSSKVGESGRVYLAVLWLYLLALHIQYPYAANSEICKFQVYLIIKLMYIFPVPWSSAFLCSC